jgi:hypothetical protein
VPPPREKLPDGRPAFRPAPGFPGLPGRRPNLSSAMSSRAALRIVAEKRLYCTGPRRSVDLHRKIPGNDEGPPKGPLASKMSRRRPTLPPRYRDSTIGAGGLNFRVRNGTGCSPSAIATETVALGRPVSPFPASPASREIREDASPGSLVRRAGPEPNSEREQKPSPRPISTGRLNTLPCVHLRPIYLVVCEGPYSCYGWEISSWGELRT